MIIVKFTTSVHIHLHAVSFRSALEIHWSMIRVLKYTTSGASERRLLGRNQVPRRALSAMPGAFLPRALERNACALVDAS